MYQILVGFHYVSLVFLLWEAGYVFTKMKTRIHAYLFFNCVATLFNNAGYLFQMISKSEDEYLSCLQLSYLGRVWIPFSLFIFVMAICKIKIPKAIMYTLTMIHGITYILVLTCRYQTLYYKSSRYVTENCLFPHLESEHGLWYSLYTLVIVAYIVIGVLHLIMVTRDEENTVAKKRLTWVTIAMTIESLGFIVNMTGVTGAYDATMIGYVFGAVCMFVAIYKYKLMETLELAKDYVIDELAEAILSVNKYGQPEYYNKPAEELLKRRSLSVHDCLLEMEKAMATNTPIRLDGRIYSPNVKTLYSDGVEHGKIYVMTDDTDHYQYMEELKEQKDIAEKANESKSAFVSVVSHEIRTPMNAVVGMTELMLRDSSNLTDKQVEYLNNIKSSGSSLVMIVNDILDQSKIEAGKMEIIESAYELRPMLTDVKMIIDNRLENKAISVEYVVSDRVPQYLIGDGLRIRQVLINLMNNAVKFTNEGYIRLKIHLMDEDDSRVRIRFVVSDSGQGIKPMDLFRLGQAFTQVDTKNNYGKEGTGLGLSISKNFIEMMGGQLEVSSEYGKGSEFSFSIWQGKANGIDEVHSTQEDSTKKSAGCNTEFIAPLANVLVVDDTNINLVIFEELVAPMGMHIDKASSGDMAIEMIKANKYDIVFMDYMMVNMDGVEVTSKVRSLAKSSNLDSATAMYYENLPIIAMSGDSSDETKNKFREAGINDFVDKPVELGRIKEQLVKWISEEKIEYK